jgi:hypothetical protein
MNVNWLSKVRDRRFHSISFPSEWGGRFQRFCSSRNDSVSIQLVSPASGEAQQKWAFFVPSKYTVSIQLVSPASGE